MFPTKESDGMQRLDVDEEFLPENIEEVKRNLVTASDSIIIRLASELDVLPQPSNVSCVWNFLFCSLSDL